MAKTIGCWLRSDVGSQRTPMIQRCPHDLSTPTQITTTRISGTATQHHSGRLLQPTSRMFQLLEQTVAARFAEPEQDREDRQKEASKSSFEAARKASEAFGLDADCAVDRPTTMNLWR